MKSIFVWSAGEPYTLKEVRTVLRGEMKPILFKDKAHPSYPTIHRQVERT